MYEVGDIMSSKSFGDFEIMEKLPRSMYKIKFIETGYESIVQGGNVKTGGVKDPYKPSVYGVGYMGTGEYYAKKDGKHTLAYKTWNDMMKRCYSVHSKDYRTHGGRGVTVCEEWHNFQQFAAWYTPRFKEGFKLDKDLTVIGSLVYSPATCCLIPNKVNCILNNGATVNQSYELPQGVNKIDGKYTARLNTAGVRKYLGYHNTPELAFAAYKTAKEAYIKEIATHHYNLGNISDKVYQNLLTYSVTPFPEEG